MSFFRQPSALVRDISHIITVRTDFQAHHRLNIRRHDFRIIRATHAAYALLYQRLSAHMLRQAALCLYAYAERGNVS
jgi:hypothetical protein